MEPGLEASEAKHYAAPWSGQIFSKMSANSCFLHRLLTCLEFLPRVCFTEYFDGNPVTVLPLLQAPLISSDPHCY